MGELGAAVVVKGRYYKLGTAPGPYDERKLFLHIQGGRPLAGARGPLCGCWPARGCWLVGAGRPPACRPERPSSLALSSPPPLPLSAGPTADIVKRAKQEIKRLLEESTEKALRREAPAAGRYSLV